MVRLSIQKMTCGGCASSITKAIQSVDRGAKIETDVEQRLVTINTSVDPQSLIDVIREAGYEAETAPSS